MLPSAPTPAHERVTRSTSGVTFGQPSFGQPSFGQPSFGAPTPFGQATGRSSMQWSQASAPTLSGVYSSTRAPESFLPTLTGGVPLLPPVSSFTVVGGRGGAAQQSGNRNATASSSRSADARHVQPVAAQSGTRAQPTQRGRAPTQTRYSGSSGSDSSMSP
ncbi:hypothetical protein CERSUDRAFT_119864 [Gelatoporia subvermispora B]|uniref:Uncharacterized protein n=1 Tax=Ceriporiopsis subvermispora (strain B) TaxID=914234 RepID=M2QZD3_CERS8|nr:hypothetical protein CERSUDRAFT_119864 [Gelatoporia subvermispora B]